MPLSPWGGCHRPSVALAFPDDAEHLNTFLDESQFLFDMKIKIVLLIYSARVMDQRARVCEGWPGRLMRARMRISRGTPVVFA